MDDLPIENGFPRTLAEMLDHHENLNGIRRLTEQFRSENRVVPFVGAGLSIPYKLKGWKDFLLHVAGSEHAKAVKAYLKKNEFEQAADFLCQTYYQPFQRAIEDEFGPHKTQEKGVLGAVRFLHLLTRGPIITTNYDHVIEQAMLKLTSKPITAVNGAQKTAIQKSIEQSSRVLIKLHGDATEESSRIITQKEYQTHYGTAGKKGYNPKLDLPRKLKQLMDGTPLLFLGCSLENDRTLLLLEAISKECNHRGHYALVEMAKTKAGFQRRIAHLKKHNIIPIWFGPGQFHLIEEFLAYLCENPGGHTTPDIVPFPPKIDPGTYRLEIGKSFFGREKELNQLEDWIKTSRAVCNVQGAPGIGKSRLCHRFLERWKAQNPTGILRYVDLTTAFTASAFLGRLVEGLQLPETIANDVIKILEKKDKRIIQDRMTAIVAYIDQAGGIVYLDNLEDPLKDELCKVLLRPLAVMRNTRVLCSSREALNTSIAQNIRIQELDDNAAQQLFAEHWQRSGAGSLAWDDAGRAFVSKILGNHALTIKLVAAQANTHGCSLKRLVSAWNKAGTSMAHSGDQSADKRDSLEVSLDLSFNALTRHPQNPIHYWALAAMFPEGMSTKAQECLSGVHWADSAMSRMLINYNVLESEHDGRLRILAPIRIYILARLRERAGGLNWQETLRVIYEQFLRPIARVAKSAEFGKDSHKEKKIDALLDEFPAFACWLEECSREGDAWKEEFAELLDFIRNFLLHRPLSSPRILELMIMVFQRNGMRGHHAKAIKKLGDLDLLSGNLPQARLRYDEAIKNFEKEHDLLGLANALQSLGDLERKLANIADAYSNFEKAILLFEKVGNELGLGNSFHSLGDLELRLGNLEKARSHYTKSLKFFINVGNDLGLGTLLRSLGNLESRLENFEEARLHFQRAIELCNKMRDELGLANVLLSFGDLEFRLENLDAAYSRYNDAFALYEKAQSDLGLANSIKNIGDVDFRRGNYESARSLYFKSIDIYKKLNSDLGIANTFQSLGDIEIKKGDYQAALNHHRQAVAIYSKAREPMGHAFSMASIATIYHDKGKYADRDEAYALALQKAIDSNSPSVLREIQNIGKSWLT